MRCHPSRAYIPMISVVSPTGSSEIQSRDVPCGSVQPTGTPFTAIRKQRGTCLGRRRAEAGGRSPRCYCLKFTRYLPDNPILARQVGEGDLQCAQLGITKLGDGPVDIGQS